MAHPTEDELKALHTLIAEHVILLSQHLEHELASTTQLERAPALVAAEVLLGQYLIAFNYEPREGLIGINGFPTMYAVHPHYHKAFDTGMYDHTSSTWSSEMGNMPSWALLQLYPQEDSK